jgi:hypothetical protein
MSREQVYQGEVKRVVPPYIVVMIEPFQPYLFNAQVTDQ